MPTPRSNAGADSHIGRRIKLRDLQILLSVAQFGSMAKAANHLSTTQPTVSQAIAELEDAIGVRLFDRSTQCVVPEVIRRIAQGHPNIVVHACFANPSEDTFQQLRDRRLDLMIGRSLRAQVDEDLLVETLFDDSFYVVVPAQNPWAHRPTLRLRN